MPSRGGRQAREVVVTGLGVILPGCDSADQFWAQIRDGESQLSFEPHPVHDGEVMAVGRIRDFDPMRYLRDIPQRFVSQYHREILFYLSSVFAAREDARLGAARIQPDRIGLFDGTSRSNFGHWYDLISRESGATPEQLRELYSKRELLLGLPSAAIGLAASLLRIAGPAYTFNATCSSGGVAMGHALREIQAGEIDVAFATGHDLHLVKPFLIMYGEANLISSEQQNAKAAVRPYVGHSTNAFGEGALTLVLEAREHAEARGAKPIAEIVAYRYGNNAYHPTTVDVAGLRPADVIRRILDETETPAEDVAFVVGHGNGVHLSDVSEENYMRIAFGSRAKEIPLLSTKPIYGHTLGASSSVNAAAACLMLKHQFIVPTINVDATKQKRNTNHQPQTGRPATCKAGLTVSYGMGGHNAILLFRTV